MAGIRSISAFPVISDMYSYLFAFREDINHTPGVYHLYCAANQFMWNAVVVFVFRKVDMVILGDLQFFVALQLKLIDRQWVK